MSFVSIRLAALPLLLIVAACGGETVGVDPNPPGSSGDDAGGTPTGTGPGKGTGPGTGTGSGGSFDAGPGLPVGLDAGPGGPIGVDASGPTCMTDADCSGGTQCAWPISEDLCTAFNPSGSCITPINEPCGAIQVVTGCGCNGQDVQWTTGCSGLPMGWAPVGIAHGGSCSTNPLNPLGLPCHTDLDCAHVGSDPAQTLVCGYDLHAGCNAAGTCVPAMAVSGDCNMEGEPGCGCDGTTVEVQCGATATSQPIVGLGTCSGVDGGF